MRQSVLGILLGKNLLVLPSANFRKLRSFCPLSLLTTSTQLQITNKILNRQRARASLPGWWWLHRDLKTKEHETTRKLQRKNAFTCQHGIVPIKEKQHEEEINKIQDSDITRYFCFYYVTNVMWFSFPLAVDITLRLHWKLADKITLSNFVFTPTFTDIISNPGKCIRSKSTICFVAWEKIEENNKNTII